MNLENHLRNISFFRGERDLSDQSNSSFLFVDEKTDPDRNVHLLSN